MPASYHESGWEVLVLFRFFWRSSPRRQSIRFIRLSSGWSSRYDTYLISALGWMMSCFVEKRRHSLELLLWREKFHWMMIMPDRFRLSFGSHHVALPSACTTITAICTYPHCATTSTIKQPSMISVLLFFLLVAASATTAQTTSTNSTKSPPDILFIVPDRSTPYPNGCTTGSSHQPTITMLITRAHKRMGCITRTDHSGMLVSNLKSLL